MRTYKIATMFFLLAATPAIAQPGFFHQSSGAFTAAVVATFSIESGTSGAKDFTVGVPLADGAVPTTGSLDIPGQFICTRSYNSGSCKHGIASFSTTLTADTPLEVAVLSTPYAAGTDLTASDIDAADLSIVVDLDTYGTVTFTDIDSTPLDVTVAGPEMIEAVYATDVGADPDLMVKIYVQYYASGRAHVRTVIINGNSDGMGGPISALNHPKTFSPATVTIGGVVAYTGTLTQDEHEFWDAEGWIGGDPGVFATWTPEYLQSTKLVSNYWKTASESALAAVLQTYIPLDDGPFIANMASGGYQTHIGLLPLGSSLYYSSGDERAFNAMVTEARSMGAFPSIWLDATTYEPMLPSTYSNWSIDGAGAGGNNSWTLDGVHTYDHAHHPSVGYAPYLITGDRFFLDTLLNQASTCWFAPGVNGGLGAARVTFRTEQLRQRSWCDRTLGLAAAITPVGENFGDEIRAVFASRIANYKALSEVAGANLLGFYDSYTNGGIELPAGTPYGDGRDAMWQYDFRVASHGWALDIDALADETNLEAVFAEDVKQILFRLGPNGSTYYCWNVFPGDVAASSFAIKMAATDTADVRDWYDTGGEVYEATFGSPNTSCGTAITGPTIANAELNYIGNALPAIAYAVDYDEPGAAAAWARLIGATNWGDVETAGFEDVPIWGIVPRGYD